MRPDALTFLRLLWLTLPVTVGPAWEDALGDASAAVRWVAAAESWALWALVLLALLVPRLLSLTVLRLGVPAVAVASVLAAVRGGVLGVDLLAVTVASVTAVVALRPTVGDALVDGSSYGPERRLPVRVPPALALGPAALAVAVVLAGVSVGPLLLAARQWVIGGIVTVVGAGLAVLAARALHTLARRFLVFVPGGVVVHDPLALVEPVLVPKGSLASVGPAPVGTEATDLTLGAGGLVMELHLQQPTDLVLRRPGRHPHEARRTDAVLVAPTRAVAFLDEARARGLPLPPAGP